MTPVVEQPEPASVDHFIAKSIICRDLRASWYQDYLKHELPSDYLKKKSPFVWYEANRQGLL